MLTEFIPSNNEKTFHYEVHADFRNKITFLQKVPDS